jgi:hypothetical protein
LLEPHAEELIGILVHQAKAGDPNALKLCIERLIPKPKSGGPSISLPNVDTSLPDHLELFREALLLTLTNQDEIDLDALKVILELISVCHSEKLAVKDDDESDQRLAELVKRLQHQTI